MDETVKTKNVFARHKGLLVILGLCLLSLVVAYFVVEDAVKNTVEHQAISVAEIVATQATTARSVYAKEIVDKLKKDGFGPNVHSETMPGFVPIPAQFLKLLGLATTEQSSKLYQYKPISKWNLEPTQGIADEFLAWAWPQLEQQDQALPAGPIAWKPIWRFETQGDKRVLRYLRADPASQTSCVSCHNAYEKTAEVIALRDAAHIPSGKQWQQHQLLGALSITIPLERVENIAAAQIRRTSIFIFAVLLPIFVVVVGFNIRLARQDRNLRNTLSQLESTEEEARLANARLLAKHDIERAFAELSTYQRAIDQHALVSVTDVGGTLIQVNEKFCELSGYAPDELLGKPHRILKSDVHSDEFFKAMWDSISRGDNWRGEICNKAKSGDLYWLDTAIVPLKDDNGAVGRFITIQIDVTARKRVGEHIAHLATHDTLTGLPNRSLLQDRIQQALAHHRRRNELLAVLFIDLDQFKAVNDSLGHDVGDLLLVEVADRLKKRMRDEDTVARQGGDEFIVLLPRVSNSQSVGTLCQSLLAILTQPYEIKGHALHISASIGIAMFADDGNDVDTLLKNSDIAMYHAKKNGRNNFQFFTPEMNELTADRHALITDLRYAIARNELQLHFQPLVDIASGDVARMEVLLRWQHPTRGSIPPGLFVPLAEDSGQIVAIGKWVLRAACLQMKTWQGQGYIVPRLAVNLSAHQFRQNTLLDTVKRALTDSGVSPECIELEITEGILMEDTDAVLETLRSLHAMGLELSIDDFGTGYSSLAYLKNFPIDTLKIDRSFVMDIVDESDDVVIVPAIIALAHGLGLKVVAEGIETAAQLAFLKRHGCDLGQGYFFSRPVPAAVAEAGFKRKTG